MATTTRIEFPTIQTQERLLRTASADAASPVRIVQSGLATPCRIRMFAAGVNPIRYRIDAWMNKDVLLQMELALLASDSTPLRDRRGQHLKQRSEELRPVQFLPGSDTGRFVWETNLSRVDVKRCRRCDLQIQVRADPPAQADDSQLLRIDRPRWAMGLGRNRAPRFARPQSDAEIEKRLNWILDRYPELSADTEAANDAVTRIWISLRGGYETPLLDFAAEEVSDEQD